MYKIQVKARYTGAWVDVPRAEYGSHDTALRVMVKAFSQQVHEYVYGGVEQTVRVEPVR